MYLVAVDHPKSRWEMPQRMLKNVRSKIPWDFKISTGKKIFTKLAGHCVRNRKTSGDRCRCSHVNAASRGRNMRGYRNTRGWKRN